MVVLCPVSLQAAKKHIPSDLITTNRTTGSREQIVTVTGGPSPRLMCIIASSYKCRDTTKNAATTGPPETARKPVTQRTSTSDISGGKAREDAVVVSKQ